MKHKNGEASTGQGEGFKNHSGKNNWNKYSHHSAAFAELRELFLIENRRKYPAIPDNYRVVPKFEDKTTNGLTRCVLTFLKLKCHHCERTGNEGRIIDDRQIVTDVIGRQRVIGSIKRIKGSGTRGTSDLKAVIGGRFVAIEIKCSATGDKQRPAQIQYQAEVEQAGGIYIIASSFPQFFNWYQSNFGRPGNER